MYKICFYVPESHLELVKVALFDAGAGKLGDYEQCCWQCQGVGQFKPVMGSTPFIGEVGELERVEEYKVEMICEPQVIKAVIASLRRAHPYEEPAFDVSELIKM